MTNCSASVYKSYQEEGYMTNDKKIRLSRTVKGAG